MKKSVKKIFILGDSISIYYGPALKRMLQGVFSYDRKREPDQSLDDVNSPIGSNGGDSRNVFEYLSRAAKNTLGDLVVLNCGLHDIKTDTQTKHRQVDNDEYGKNVESIISRLIVLGTKILWVATTAVEDNRHNSLQKNFYRYNRDVLSYRQVAHGIMNRYHVPIADLYTFTLNLGADVYIDHVHFKKEVCDLQAAFIAGFLMGLAGGSG